MYSNSLTSAAAPLGRSNPIVMVGCHRANNIHLEKDRDQKAGVARVWNVRTCVRACVQEDESRLRFSITPHLGSE
jgi:hypothetical protein